MNSSELQFDLRRISAFRSKYADQVVVVTNGCFDLPHAGHITSLVHAKQQGDILVVAVNTDESVTQNKGPTRPVNALLHRMQFLTALPFVDQVVAFNQTSPVQLYSQLLPDVLVKGDEYDDGRYMPERAVVGRIVFTPTVIGHSSTKMVADVTSAFDRVPSSVSDRHAVKPVVTSLRAPPSRVQGTAGARTGRRLAREGVRSY